MAKSPQSILEDSIDTITSKAKKDIVDSYTNAIQEEQIRCESLCYGCVLVFYMHLEGCIKRIAELYLVFLEKQLCRIQLNPHLNYIITNNKADDIKWIKRISIKKKEDKRNSSKLIDTLNNLDYETLKQILFIVNLQEEPYKVFADSLDTFVKIRHNIAHGHISIYHGNLEIKYEQLTKYKQLAIDIIMLFRNNILEAIEKSTYKN